MIICNAFLHPQLLPLWNHMRNTSKEGGVCGSMPLTVILSQNKINECLQTNDQFIRTSSEHDIIEV